MRSLDIVLMGTSLALDELTHELEQHGHRLLRLREPLESDSVPPQADLLIEDGSLKIDSAWLADLAAAVQLSLCVGLLAKAPLELPSVELQCWHECSPARRLLVCQVVESTGTVNGQELRRAAVSGWVDRIALEISRFSRDAAYFEQAMLPAVPLSVAEPLGLLALEQLAFAHCFNQTTRPDLLALACTSLSERLVRSLSDHAQRPALNLGGRRVSYQALEAQAAVIQRHILAQLDQGGDSQAVIGICLPRCSALYAGILAILASGAVYLPLDPNLPLQRQQFILDNAGACLLLHDGTHPLGSQWPGLDISTLAANAGTGSALQLAETASDAPCMALYTSGTTGQPKGVLLSQRNLSHFTAWYVEYVMLTAQSRVLQFSTLSFDSSVIDIFPTLLTGAELFIPSEDERRDPLQLVTLIGRECLSHAFLPPALLSLLPLDKPLGLQHLMTGGDVCEPYVIERLSGHCRLYNLYGPTEATVLVTARRMAAGDSNRLLGRPIANSQVLILNEQLQPVGQQETGEIHIAGPGVCLGYLGNPALTAERYVQLALPDGQQLRAYRTGDMGRWTAAGIELSGRRDNQVKIRGFRVEPEEIEGCLRASQQYRQVAVVVDSRRRLLAFLAQPASDAALDALKAHAQRLLPDYMWPTAYTVLERLPSASNGKVDRQALLALPVGVTPLRAHQAPQTPEEQRLVELWSELLELAADDISTDESFFNLGGHSILLSQLLLSIREHFGRSVSINRFIEDPTIRKLGALVSGRADQGALSQQALNDACRPLALDVLPISRMGDVHKVVVTGANSFVGVHLVQALLDWGATEVACLVRDSADMPAAQRFNQALMDNHLGHLDLSRVRVHAADMTQPRLGLAEQVYETLDREYGALIHNAANVNHVMDYESLAGDNVEPLFECLRFCEGQSKKIFNFVSTLSASSSIDSAGNVLEQPPADTPPIYIRNGYNLSKWVGERLLQRAAGMGVRVNLYRPGNISFNSRTGVCQPHKNRLMLMLKGSLQLGQVPALDLNFDLMPVDFLARFIAFHCSQHQPRRAVFNLHNPEPLSWGSYVASFREAGRPFEMVSVEHWQRQLSRVDSTNALFGVLGFYLNGFEEDIGDISLIDHDNASAGVHRMGEQYPRKTPELLRKGCEYLKQIEFI